MVDVQETQLPGIGVRHEFVTDDGNRLAVLSHRTGRRDLLIYDSDDPDSCRSVIRLGDDDARTLRDLLGGSQVSEQLAAMQRIQGLAIDWLPVKADSPIAGRTLRDAALRSDTGVSVVAVLRGDETIAAPPPDFTLLAGDTLVAVGTSEGIERFFSVQRQL